MENEILKRKPVDSRYEVFKEPNWWQKWGLEAFIILGGLATINLIFFANAYTETDTVNPENAAQLGDFVGGYIGTIFTLISVVLLVSTLKNQIEASRIEKFENKYFELIKMHRENVTEFGTDKYNGKKLFVLIIREFRLIQKIVKEVATDLSLSFTDEQFFSISYYVLFIGVGPNSSRMLLKALSIYGSNFASTVEKKLNDEETKDRYKKERNLEYTPFEGHQSRLGHYFRHLFQAISYVDDQKTYINKYDYVKTIRAQLTTHEQALLFINSLSPIGKSWNDIKLIARYKLVKNIPEDFFDPQKEINLTSYFPSDYFEWQENQTASS
ncbi:putative phage abortive infection protein [Dyadobacter sp. 50-39]|uniref:putative phage abortive infection protein n=1 Tax=Dyadobacter sp. 50-39 TaxID=1895756 RepID=UPI000AC876D1|nr:putative phage abortive infection protein [Dyadobacter sp. 50-39]